jgi:PAS domain S-box-containing protein
MKKEQKRLPGSEREGNIRRHILLPLGIALLISAIVTIFASYRIHHLHMAQQAGERLQIVQNLLPALLDKNAAALAAQLDGLSTCPLFQQALLAGDLTALRARTLPFLTELTAQYGIMDLTFLLPDQSILLRLRDPAEFGDRFDSHGVFAEAVQSGRPIHGLELDPAGVISLRLIRPLYIHHQIAGFIDLRREIHGLAMTISRAVGSDIWLTASKEKLDQERWQRAAGPERAAQWGRFSHKVLIAGSKPDMPPAFAAFIDRPHAKQTENSFTTIARGWTLQGGHLPLFAVDGHEIGEMFLLEDASELVAALSRLRLVFLGVLSLTAAGVFAFLYFFLGRIQIRLFDRRAALLAEIDNRRQVEVALRGLKENLERQVVDRTSALSDANLALQREIDERLRAEQDARAAWSDLQQIFNASGSGMIIHDKNRTITSANNTASLLLGRPLHELIGRKCHHLISCPHPHTPQCCTHQILKGTRQVECEVNVERSGNRPAWLLLSSTPLRDAAGEIVGVVQSFQDITQRKQAEEELRNAKEEWEQTFNAMSDIVTLQNLDLRIIRANRAAGEALGVAADMLIGRHCYEVFRGASEPCENCPELSTLGNQRLHAREIEHPNLGRTFLVSASPIIDSNGVSRGLVHVARDITAQKKFESQLQQIRKMEAVGILAAGVAHDFNNILTGVLGYSELILQEAATDTSLRQDVEQIIELGRRGAGLTRQLLAFSRNHPRDTSVVNLNDLVGNLMKMLGRLLGEDIKIVFNPAPDLGLIKADLGQMEQIILNLAMNARDAMPDGGTIVIKTANVEFDADQLKQHPDSTPGSHVMLSVSDTGMGMDQDTMEHIYEPFFTTKEVGQGTGLGLSTLYGIVQQHRGSILASSQPGCGTVFKIFLPSMPEQFVDQNQGAEGALPRGRETILLAEDDKAVRTTLSRALEELGYTVLAAKNRTEAEDFLVARKGAIDLLFTDVVMPDGNGMELYRLLADRQPGLRVLFMSGYSETVMQRKEAAFAGMPFIQKPFTTCKAARAVRGVLDD